MMKILDIYAKGYAGATMGGTSFMVNIEFPKERFSSIEEKQNDGYMLNILIPNAEYGSEPKFKLVSKLIDKQDASISLWGEDEELTEEELQLVRQWVKEYQIEEQAAEIKKEIKEVTNRTDAILKEKKKWYGKKWINIDEHNEREAVLEKLKQEHQSLVKRYDELHGK